MYQLARQALTLVSLGSGAVEDSERHIILSGVDVDPGRSFEAVFGFTMLIARGR